MFLPATSQGKLASKTKIKSQKRIVRKVQGASRIIRPMRKIQWIGATGWCATTLTLAFPRKKLSLMAAKSKSLALYATRSVVEVLIRRKTGLPRQSLIVQISKQLRRFKLHLVSQPPWVSTLTDRELKDGLQRVEVWPPGWTRTPCKDSKAGHPQWMTQSAMEPFIQAKNC